MTRLIDSAILICILYFFNKIGNNIPNVLGGSTILCMLFPFIYYISYGLKVFQMEMTLLSLLLLIVMGINYLNYYDLSGGSLKIGSFHGIAPIYCALIVSALLCIRFVLLKPLNYSKSIEHYSRARITYKYIVLKNLVYLFGCILFISILFDSFKNWPAVKNHIINIIPVSLIWVPVFLLVIKLELSKLIKSKHINYIFKEIKIESPQPFNWRRAYSIFMLIIFILGSMVELLRKEWVVWFETFFVVNASILLTFSIYKYRSPQRKDTILDEILDFKPYDIYDTPQVFIINIIVFALSITTVMLGIIFLIKYYS